MSNKFGSNENLEAVEFLRKVNSETYLLHPSTFMIAEESTSWPGISKSVDAGGLGFGFKWNMGFMSREAAHRKYHHNDMTFGVVYAFSENFVLPLSHDEVVHSQGSLLEKMPGDDWQKFAKRLIADLNLAYREFPALHNRDCKPERFEWVIENDHGNSVLAWLRKAPGSDPILVMSNFTLVPHSGYKIPMPIAGKWVERINTDAG